MTNFVSHDRNVNISFTQWVSESVPTKIPPGTTVLYNIIIKRYL